MKFTVRTVYDKPREIFGCVAARMVFGASERREKILVQHEVQRSSVGKYCCGAKHQGADLERIANHRGVD